MAVFTWVPDFPPNRTTTPRVRVVKFGDGYEQRSTDGINTRPHSWSLTFSARTNAEADALEAFLEARNALESFDWTPPTGAAGKYVCRSWNRTMDKYNVNTVTAQFDLVYEP